VSTILKDKKIPAVAITSLVLGGSCKNDDDGGVSVSSVANAICTAIERCEPEYFYFDSIAECTSAYTEYVQYDFDYMVDYYGAACANAYLELNSCYAEAYRDCDISASEYSRCEQLYYNAMDVCGEM